MVLTFLTLKQFTLPKQDEAVVSFGVVYSVQTVQNYL